MASEQNGRHEANDVTVMPVVPDSLGVSPLLLALLHVASLLDFADDETVEADAANGALEHVELYVQRLTTAQLEAIQADLDRIEEFGAEHGWPEEVTDFVADFLYNCGLGDEEDDSPGDEDA
ncbi:MAG: hypothetical protein JW751_22900 [Polyangiaceae bacterium]|nr:hypothetical protein [Polyangiaceae bacterium]